MTCCGWGRTFMLAKGLLCHVKGGVEQINSQVDGYEAERKHVHPLNFLLPLSHQTHGLWDVMLWMDLSPL